MKHDGHSEVSLKEKIGYGLGDAASSMFWRFFHSILLFFIPIFLVFGRCSRYNVPCNPDLGYSQRPVHEL
jgi:hypothetical protein